MGCAPRTVTSANANKIRAYSRFNELTLVVSTFTTARLRRGRRSGTSDIEILGGCQSNRLCPSSIDMAIILEPIPERRFRLLSKHGEIMNIRLKQLKNEARLLEIPRYAPCRLANTPPASQHPVASPSARCKHETHIDTSLANQQVRLRYNVNAKLMCICLVRQFSHCALCLMQARESCEYAIRC